MCENSFTGIYKKPADDYLIHRYREARQALAKDNIEDAEEIIRAAIDYGQTHSLISDVCTLQCIQHELELYKQARRSDALCKASSALEVKNLDLAQIVRRPMKVWCEKMTQLPQSVFYLRISMVDEYQPPLMLVGRKLLSNLFVSNRIPELHCSQVRASMLLGLLHHIHSSENMLRIHYYPLQFNEKSCLFNLIEQNHRHNKSEIIYPFCILHPSTHKELCSESDGWLLTDEMATELGEGESSLRDYSVQTLQGQRQEPWVIYDPACSTGQFLSELKRHFPRAHTIGQDLSESMVEFARQQGNVDETVHANALLWPFGDRLVDIAFVRFLNSEVVTTEAALLLFDNIATRVKSNGLIIVFGHTPVLLASTDFLLRGSLTLEQCVGVTNDAVGTAVFQYYVLRVH